MAKFGPFWIKSVQNVPKIVKLTVNFDKLGVKFVNFAQKYRAICLILHGGHLLSKWMIEAHLQSKPCKWIKKPYLELRAVIFKSSLFSGG